MKRTNTKNQKWTNLRNALATGILGFIIAIIFMSCGMQQDGAAELNVAAVEAEVLGEQDARNLDTAAVAVDRIVEVAEQSQIQTVTNTVVETVEVPVTNTVVETQVVEVPVIETVEKTVEKIVEVPVEKIVEVEVEKVVEVDHVYALTNTSDNGNGTYTCTFTCGTCDDSYDVVIGTETEIHEHNFTVVDEKAATCTADGFVKEACDCGSEKVQIVEAFGHNHVVDETTAVEPTFDAEGKEADKICENCGDVISGKILPRLEKEEEEPEHECVFVTETKEATCEEDGFVKEICECGKETTEVIPATGHNYVEVEGSAVEPTFETEGKEADQKCTNCGDVITGASIDKLVAEHSHAYVETARVEATCTEAGYVEFTCECGDSYREELAATGHSYVVDESSYVEATEEAAGKEADEVCEHCGDRIEGATIPQIVVEHTSHKDETYCEFNCWKWGFPTAFGGQCTSYEAYLSYLEANYPDCEIVIGTCMVEVAGEMLEGTFVYAE